MSKYQDLCEKLENTLNTFEESRSEFTKIFTEKFSNYLGCEANDISLKFEAQSIFKGMVMHEFNVEINLVAGKNSERISPEEWLSCYVVLLSEEYGYRFNIEYKKENYDLDQNIDQLFDVIFKELQRFYL